MVESMTKSMQRVNIQGGQDGSKHSYHMEEVSSFSQHINYYLNDDADLADILPVNSDSTDIFSIVEDGILLCKMINKAQPGTIDTRAINENLNLAIQSAKNIGCVMVNIHPELIASGSEHIILGFIWQIIRAQTLGNIDLKHHPYLIRLKEENEELADLLKLPKELLLMRWFNYHLKNSGSTRRISNFDKDLMDGENYVVLLNAIAPSQCDKSALNLQGNDRAAKVISDARKLGVPPCIKPQDITSGNQQKLNLLHCAHIFNHCPGLTPTEEEKLEAAGLIDDDNDPEASREERVFRMWINSMNLEDVYINNLIQDLRDGLILGKVLNKLKPGCIGPKALSSQTNMRIQRIQNANKVMEVSTKELGCKAVGIGGVDIVDGNKKLILAMIWQLMKIDVLNVVGGVKEEDLVKWANSHLEEQYRIKNLKEKSLADGQFFIRLLASIEPQLINWDYVTPGQTEDDVMNNAKYVLSVARKLGCSVFLVWEHIRDVNPKFLLTLVAAIKSTGENYSQSKQYKNSVANKQTHEEEQQ